MLGPLPVAEPNPLERLRKVREAMKGVKENGQAVGAHTLSRLSDFAPPTLLAQAARVPQVLAELLIVGTLGVVAWRTWDSRSSPPAAAAPYRPPLPGAGRQHQQSRTPAEASALPTAAAPTAGPTPGIRTDADFLSRQMGELNRVESAFADVEWRATKATADAIQYYLERVVRTFPGSKHAEQANVKLVRLRGTPEPKR